MEIPLNSSSTSTFQSDSTSTPIVQQQQPPQVPQSPLLQPISIPPAVIPISIHRQIPISTSTQTDSTLPAQCSSQPTQSDLLPVLSTCLLESGFHSTQPSALHSLSSKLDRFLHQTCSFISDLSTASGRNELHPRDLLAGLVAGGIVGNKYGPPDGEGDIEEDGRLLDELKGFVQASKMRDMAYQQDKEGLGYRQRYAWRNGTEQQEIREEEDWRLRKDSFLPSDGEDELDDIRDDDDDLSDLELRNRTLDKGKGKEKDSNPSNSIDNEEDLKLKRQRIRETWKRIERKKLGVGLEGERKVRKLRGEDKNVGIIDGDDYYDEDEGVKGKEVLVIGGGLSHLPDLPPRHTWVFTEAFAPRPQSTSTSLSLSHLDLKLQSTRLTAWSLRKLIRGIDVAESRSGGKKEREKKGKEKDSNPTSSLNPNNEKSENNQNKQIESGSVLENPTSEKLATGTNNSQHPLSISASTLDSSNSLASSTSVDQSMDMDMSGIVSSSSSSVSNFNQPTTGINDNSSISSPNPTPSTPAAPKIKPKTLLRLRMPSSTSTSGSPSTSIPNSGTSTPDQLSKVPMTSLPRNLLSETHGDLDPRNRRFSVGSGLGSGGFSTPIRRSTFSNVLDPKAQDLGLTSPMTPWSSMPGGSFAGVPMTPRFDYPATPVGIGEERSWDSESRFEEGDQNLRQGDVVDGQRISLPGCVNFKKDWYSMEGNGKKVKGKGRGKRRGSGAQDGGVGGEKKKRWII